MRTFRTLLSIVFFFIAIMFLYQGCDYLSKYQKLKEQALNLTIDMSDVVLIKQYEDQYLGGFGICIVAFILAAVIFPKGKKPLPSDPNDTNIAKKDKDD